MRSSGVEGGKRIRLLWERVGHAPSPPVAESVLTGVKSPLPAACG